MEIETLVVGPIETNCYVVSDPVSKAAVVIDPGDDGYYILQYLERNQLQVQYILLTHGHYDHMQAADEVRAATGAPLAVHSDDQELLTNPEKVSRTMYVEAKACGAADLLLHNGDVLEFGPYHLQVIFTPGHSKGGCCFYEAVEQVCFSGDTLFRGGVGRTDLYGGNRGELLNSIKKRMAGISDGTEVYPGHGPSTTMQFERRVNQFLQ